MAFQADEEQPFPGCQLAQGRDYSDSTALRIDRELEHLLTQGFNVSQVVHCYGDICQAITELALEQHVPISVQEFHTLNRCLDTAIAEAVTEHARLTAQKTGTEETERLGQVAHELRNLVNTAVLAFQTVTHGAVRSTEARGWYSAGP